MTETTYTPGLFVWRELMTTDVAKAREFYGELFGWTYQDHPFGDGGTYTMIAKGDKMLGGMMAMTDAPHPPHWMSYVSVDDVDAAAKRAGDVGGTVAVPPTDIPNVGRFSVIGDPDHAYFTLFKSAQGDPTPGMPGVGTFCWETLATSDIEKAKSFYEHVLGWKAGPGPGGNADMPVFSAGESQVADVQQAQGMPPSWMTYVVVEKLEDANARATKLGATIVVPLIEVPHVGRISLMRDPAGAHLGLFEPQMG